MKFWNFLVSLTFYIATFTYEWRVPLWWYFVWKVLLTFHNSQSSQSRPTVEKSFQSHLYSKLTHCTALVQNFQICFDFSNTLCEIKMAKQWMPFVSFSAFKKNSANLSILAKRASLSLSCLSRFLNPLIYRYLVFDRPLLNNKFVSFRASKKLVRV